MYNFNSCEKDQQQIRIKRWWRMLLNVIADRLIVKCTRSFYVSFIPMLCIRLQKYWL